MQESQPVALSKSFMCQLFVQIYADPPALDTR